MPAALPFIVAATSIASVGLTLAGASKQASAQKNMAAQQQEQIRLQQQAEEQRKKAMEMDARRRQMELLRQQQRGRSIALTNATAQGGAFGSGLQGGFGQISGQGNNQQLGIQQNLGIGENLFGINSQISDSRILSSQYQSSALEGGALMSLGGTLMNNAGRLNSLFGGVSPSSSQSQPLPYISTTATGGLF